MLCIVYLLVYTKTVNFLTTLNIFNAHKPQVDKFLSGKKCTIDNSLRCIFAKYFSHQMSRFKFVQMIGSHVGLAHPGQLVGGVLLQGVH